MNRTLISLSGLNYDYVYFDSSQKLFETLYSYPEISSSNGKQMRGELEIPQPVEVNLQPTTLPIDKIHFLQRAARWASLADRHCEETEDNSSHSVIQNALQLKQDQRFIFAMPKIEVFRDTTGKVWTLNHRRLAACLLSGVVNQVPVEWVDIATATGNLNKYYPINEGRSIDVVNRFQRWGIRISHRESYHLADKNRYDTLLNELPKKSMRIVSSLNSDDSNLPKWISSSALVKGVVDLNLKALQGVTRKNGKLPYVDHVVRLGALLDSVLPESYPGREELLAGAVNHDYLEEGPGLTREQVEILRSRKKEVSSVGFLAAVLLTEPAITFDRYSKKFDFQGDANERIKQIEKSSYIVQLRDSLSRIRANGDADLARALADIALADKIVNAQDFDFIFNDKNLKEHQTRGKISLIVGTYSVVLSSVAEFASPILVDILRNAILQLGKRADLNELEIAMSYYNSWLGVQSICDELSRDILLYHKDYLGMSESDYRP